jgi:hypothetical protein
MFKKQLNKTIEKRVDYLKRLFRMRSSLERSSKALKTKKKEVDYD